MCKSCGGNAVTRSWIDHHKPLDTCMDCGADVTREMAEWEARREQARIQRFAGAQR